MCEGAAEGAELMVTASSESGDSSSDGKRRRTKKEEEEEKGTADARRNGDAGTKTRPVQSDIITKQGQVSKRSNVR